METTGSEIDYSLILIYKYPASKWTLNANDYKQLVWLSDDTKPTKTQLESKWPEVQEIINAKKQAKIDARIAAEQKLAALGVNPDDLKALGL